MKKRAEELKLGLMKSYAKVAENASFGCSASCLPKSASVEEIGRRIGYENRDMQAVPPGSNLGLGCGNPVAIASLKEGQIVLDLGSGAGFDSFLASRAVGGMGMVIGVDMTARMVKRAKENALDHIRKGGQDNVEFIVGEIESLPVKSFSIDAVISNCSINLVYDKELAFSEAFRVLKAGGRLVVSDIVQNKSLPDFILQSIKKHVGCVAGASTLDRYLDAIRSAGFDTVEVVEEASFPLDCMIYDPTGRAISLGLKGSGEERAKIEDRDKIEYKGNIEGPMRRIMVCALKPGGE